MTAQVPEVPQVSDPANEPKKLRRFTEVVSNILNALQRRGQIVKEGPADYSLSGVTGGLAPGTYTNATVVVGPDGDITSVTSGGGGGGSDPISSIYPVFAVTGDDDEFTSGTFPTGWTAVNSGSHTPTITETNNVLSILHPGGDANAELHAWMKTATITTNSFVECAFRSAGTNQLPIAGLVMADGTTYGSGKQFICYFSEVEAAWAYNLFTGYNSQGGPNKTGTVSPLADIFLRIVYNGSSTFSTYISADGISWVLCNSAVSYSGLTPTVAGFFVTTWGGASPHNFSFRYVKFG